MRKIIIAWQFLTIIPITDRIETTPEDLGRSMAYFPAVGGIIGVILVISYMFLDRFFPSSIVDIISILILAVITRGIHLDGFADTIDGIVGGIDKRDALSIMRDGRIGPMAVIGLILLLGLKYLSLYNLPVSLKLKGLLLMPMAGRWTMAALASVSRYAREEEGLGRPFTDNAAMNEVITATIIIAVTGIFLFGLKSIFILMFLGLITFLMKLYFDRRFGGITGDILGAVNEINEAALLLILIIIAY
ncbi:MAG: adenosylcobinamide-GDP ribazoletransferase [Nitrospirota bacterium]